MDLYFSKTFFAGLYAGEWVRQGFQRSFYPGSKLKVRFSEITSGVKHAW